MTPGPAAQNPEEYTVTSSAVLDFLLGAQRPMITTRHPEEDGDEYGIFEDLSKKASSCKSIGSTCLHRPAGKSLGQSRLVRSSEDRNLRRRSLAHRGNCGLLTVEQACASEFFFLHGSTVCETGLEMREQISKSAFGGQSFCCERADFF